MTPEERADFLERCRRGLIPPLLSWPEVKILIAEELEAAVSRVYDYWMAAKPEPTLLGIFAVIRARP